MAFTIYYRYHSLLLSVLILAVFAWSSVCRSQTSISLGLGASGYQGDIPSYNLSNSIMIEIHPALSVGISTKLMRALDLETDLVFGRISGNDALAKDQIVRDRNLSFRSDIMEISAGLNLFVLDIFSDAERPFSLYLRAGVGYFHFNPQARLEGKWHNLQPLGTEGQFLDTYPKNRPYKRMAISFPVGGGFLIRIKDRQFRLEFLSRATSTDYLDDVSTFYVNPELLLTANEETGRLSSLLSDRSWEVSQDGTPLKNDGDVRGNPLYKDVFWTTTLKIQVPISSGGNLTQSKYSKCPRF